MTRRPEIFKPEHIFVKNEMADDYKRDMGIIRKEKRDIKR